MDAKPGESESTALAVQGVEIVEYTLKHRQQGVFTHSRLDVVRTMEAQLIVADHRQGVEKEYSVTERVVTYPELDVWPVADKDGTVAEKLQGQSSRVKERKL